MNSPDADSKLDSSTPAADAGSDEAAAPTKRRRTPRKIEAAVLPDLLNGAADGLPLADAPSKEAVFSRGVSGPTDAAPATYTESAAPAVTLPVVATVAPAVATQETSAAAALDESSAAFEGPPALPCAPADDGAGPRRSRNRRRGRRGGEKLRPDGVSTPPQAVAAPVPPPEAGDVFLQVLSGEFDGESALRSDADANADTDTEADADADADAETSLKADVKTTTEPGGNGVEQAALIGDGTPYRQEVLPPDAPVADGDLSAAGTAVAAQAAPESAKRVLAPDADAPKLHKVLAQAGVGSRRDLEAMIGEGRVTVNGEVAHTGQRISYGDRIQLDSKPVRYRIAPPPARVLAYHKPAGEVVTHDDPQQRPTVFRRLPRLQHGKWQSVGRLDINTEGLLLFTNSGELANQLMHPRFGVEREYAVRSLGVLAVEARTRLLEGVEIDGQRAAFKSLEDGGGEGVNHWYRVVITEGRNREVRRLFEAVGHAVSRLIRIRYGSVVLPRGLKRGVWVDLEDNDLRQLRRLTSGPRPQGMPSPGGPDGGLGATPDGAGRKTRNRNGRKRGDGDQQPGQSAQVQGDRGERNTAMEAGPPAERAPQERPPRLERAPRPDRAPRPERGPRPDRGLRPERGPRPEPGEGGAIPNPLQQTFDKRAFQLDRQQRRDMPEDGPIPNPLQQTYDKRALQRDRMPQRDMPEDGPIPNPLQQTYDKRFAQAGHGGNGYGKRQGARGTGGVGGPGGQGGTGGGGHGADPDRIPDPLQTAVGYIGANAFHRKNGKGGKGSGGGGARRSGGGVAAAGRGPGGPAGSGGPGGNSRGGKPGGGKPGAKFGGKSKGGGRR